MTHALIDALEAAKLSIALRKSIEHETMKKHLENMIGALAELLDREENRDVDTAEQFVAAVKFMNEHAGMTFKARQMQEYLEAQNNPH